MLMTYERRRTNKDSFASTKLQNYIEEEEAETRQIFEIFAGYRVCSIATGDHTCVEAGVLAFQSTSSKFTRSRANQHIHAYTYTHWRWLYNRIDRSSNICGQISFRTHYTLDIDNLTQGHTHTHTYTIQHAILAKNAKQRNIFFLFQCSEQLWIIRNIDYARFEVLGSEVLS